MLMPKRSKHRKTHRGKRGGQALEAGWLDSRQIESARRTITRYIKRGGKVWIRIFPDKPVTAKPAETRMGSGKGAPDHWVAVVRPGRVLFELAGVRPETAAEAMRLAGHKLPIRHPSLLPKIALVDPLLMLSMPRSVTMSTGIDALSHAMECFTQVREHPFADTLCLQAMKLIADNLPKAIASGKDEEARSNMALAATMAGTGFEVGGLQFHAYAQALGAKYHAPHGITCGIALRAGLRQILPTATAKLARMAWAFGIDARNLTPAQAAEKAVAAAIAFINEAGIPKIAEAMKATKADVPMLIKETLETTGVPIAPETAEAVWEKIFS